jgi:hypothetical protein
MANISAYAAKAQLDWILGGATPTRPTTQFVALSFGTPTSVSALGEIQVNSGYSRQTATFGAAASPAGSCSNNNGMTFGPFSSNQSVIGLIVYDTATINSGNMLWYGTLLTNRTVLPGDTLVIAAGNLLITLA